VLDAGGGRESRTLAAVAHRKRAGFQEANRVAKRYTHGDNLTLPMSAHIALAYASSASRLVLRVIILLTSRTHKTELATAAQTSQSPTLKAVVENASCRTGT
jgi:hypothetical protein